MKTNKSNMYSFIDKTRNFLGGECQHKCQYCFINSMKNKFPNLKERYSGEIRLLEKELDKNEGINKTIFVQDMGDLFEESVPAEFILKILGHLREYPENTYLFQTKNPKRYFEFEKEFPENSLLGCYDEKTRALTPEGFKKYNELNEGDEVFTINPITEKIEINKIKGIIVKKYKGNMIRIKGRRVNLLVTPDHKILRRTGRHSKLKFEEAKDVAKKYQFRLPLGNWNKENTINYLELDGKNIHINDVCYLVGIFIGDGWTDKKKIKRISRTGLNRKEWLEKASIKSGGWKKLEENAVEREYPSRRIILSIPKKDKARERVENVLNKYKIKHSCYETEIYFSSNDWQKIFLECGKGAKEKTIPEWLLKEGKEALESLFFGIMDSDGHQNRKLVTTSERLLSPFTELCMKIGKTIRITKQIVTGNRLPDNRINKNISIVYRISCGKTMPFMKSSNLKEEYYEGIIWCCSVDNKNLFIEREGTSTFCGNSTIETNYEDEIKKISNAPSISARQYWMQRLKFAKTFLTLEPLVEFDLEEMIKIIKDIQPDFVNIGADSKRNNLSEPSWNKVQELIKRLKEFTEVKIKSNLERLKNDTNTI